MRTRLKLVDSESILKITERVVQHAAKKGNCVIVGRGSQQFLRNRQDTLRVFLYAPREDKVRRLVARGKSEKDAAELVDTVDRERIDFLRKYFRVEWPDRAVYHTMINTAVGEQAVLKIIMDLAKTLDAEVTAGELGYRAKAKVSQPFALIPPAIRRASSASPARAAFSP